MGHNRKRKIYEVNDNDDNTDGCLADVEDNCSPEAEAEVENVDTTGEDPVAAEDEDNSDGMAFDDFIDECILMVNGKPVGAYVRTEDSDGDSCVEIIDSITGEVETFFPTQTIRGAGTIVKKFVTSKGVFFF